MARLNTDDPEVSTGFTRRTFLGASAAGATGLLTGGLSSLFQPSAEAAAGPWFEASIPQLQRLMRQGALTSQSLTEGYLRTIRQLNPLLHAVIEINTDALKIARQFDQERRQGHVRGPLHGIPILVKDNIATLDRMQTTAGSLALIGSRVPEDAPILARLRAAGAVILGKSNLGEWANFRGFNPLGFYGWSARGNPTHNPYVLSYSSLGSSSGSGVGPAANMCAAAIGTETDGSIIGPANVNLVVGLKPSVGLVSQNGIIPISHAQDTAGPIARNVTDVAILLGVIQSPFGAVRNRPVPSDYTRFLKRGALAGKRIGVDRRFFDQYTTYGLFADDVDTLPFVEEALLAMAAAGATIIETDSGDYFAYAGDEFTALQFEFKVHVAQYLKTLRNTTMRTLGDLIAFNNAHCADELVYYGQEIFELSDATSGNLMDPAYVAVRRNAFLSARNGIDTAINQGNLDAIVAPHLTNTTAPAVAGYPNISVPVGIRSNGKPASLMLYSGFLREPMLLAIAYDLEQELNARRPPRFLGAIADPPNAELCTATLAAAQAFTRYLGRTPRFF